MPLPLVNIDQEYNSIVSFVIAAVDAARKKNVVIAVSGGIDSALALTIATAGLGHNHVIPVFLPYKDQSIADSEEIVAWNKFPPERVQTINIGSMVDAIAQQLQIGDDALRLGNVMARVRMITIYDLAKKFDALVCGTENKSEKHLGYFTRFGDEASDIEPIQHLYKTQVRQIAQHIGMPSTFLEKPPSAGLWRDQTDEQELGFSYEEADKALAEIIDNLHENADPAVKQKVLARVNSQRFKHEVPYHL